MLNNENETPYSTSFIQGIYQEATNKLGKLCTNPDDSKARGALDALN